MATLQRRRLLLAQAVIPPNLLRWSEAFDNAAWTKTASVVTADAATAPDGTTTADKLTELATAAQHLASQVATVDLGTTYTASCYIKAAERTEARVLLTDGGGNQLAAHTVNLTTGASTISAGTTTITNAGAGWWRVSAAGVATTTSAALRVYPLSGGTSGYLGVVNSGIYIWGGMLNAGSLAPYQRTV